MLSNIIVALFFFFSFRSISKDFPCISYQECSAANIMKCSSFWIAGLHFLVSVWDFSVFWKKTWRLLEWNITHSDRQGLNYIFRFPNEVIPGLKCHTHFIGLIVQRCRGTHRKIRTPDVIQRVKTVPCSESQCQAYALPCYNLISVLGTWMIGLILPFFVCTLVTVTCSFTGIYRPVTYKWSQLTALFLDL